MKQDENNRVLKIIAILIAVVLWFYVGVEQDPLERSTYYVPVTVENLSADKAATLARESVAVTVMGRQGRLDAISAEDFKASVDLSGAEVGDVSAKVQLALPSEVYFAKIEPPVIDVMVSAREGETMPVETVQSGVLPDGVTLEEMTVSPETVFVSGDSEALSRVAKAGVSVDMTKIVKDSRQEVPVEFYDYEGNVISDAGLQASPATVTLSVKVSSVDVEKTVPIQAELVGSLPQGLSVESVVVSPDVATVSGSPETLLDVHEVKTEAIDLSRLTGTTTLSVDLVGKHLVGAQTVSVTVTVAETESADTGQTYTKVVPVVLTGEAASQAVPETPMVEITYHMLAGYEDAGEALSAYINVDAVPAEGVAATVQIGNIEGLVIDSMSPSTIMIYTAY